MIKLNKKQKAALKSYLRGVLVSFLTFITTNELGLPTEWAIFLSALAGPAAKALDKTEKDFGSGSN